MNPRGERSAKSRSRPIARNALHYRHDSLHIGELFAPPAFQKYSRLYAQGFASEKQGTTGSLQRENDAPQRFFWRLHALVARWCETARA
jgi:hypothetical protein